jgi:tetratricopeptide (TPR) repeat protein
MWMTAMSVTAALAGIGCATPFEQGMAYQRDGDLPAAAALFQRAVGEDPRNVGALVQLGTTYNLERQYGYAFAPLRTAAQLAPSNPAPHFSLAVAYEGIGSPADALREYQTTFGLDRRCYKCLYAIGLIFAGAGDLVDALPALDGYLAMTRGMPSERGGWRRAADVRAQVVANLAAIEREQWFAEHPPVQPPMQPPTSSVADGPRPAPRDGSIEAPNQDVENKALGALAEVVLGEGFRRGVAGNDDAGSKALGVLASALRDHGIEKGLAIAFPSATENQIGFMRVVVVTFVEEDSSVMKLGQAAFREWAVQRLKANFPDDAQALTIANFLWDFRGVLASN